MIGWRDLPVPLQRLNELTKLGDGWDFGRGASPSLIAHIHSTAVALITTAAGASSFEFFPEDDGGILVVAYRGKESFEILATADGNFEVAFEDDAGLSPATKIDSLQEVLEQLEHHGWQSPKSSGSFTHSITAPKRAATFPLPLGQMPTGFLSSTQNVSLGKGIRVVPMPNSIIPGASEDHPRYSGGSIRRNLLQVAS